MKYPDWDASPETNDGADGSKLPVLCGITPETPGFGDGVYNAVIRKAQKLAKDNPANLSGFATEIAAEVFKARASWNPDKGKWKPFAGRAIKWAAMHLKRGEIDHERAYKWLVCQSLDAPIRSDDPESDTFEATATEDAFCQSRRLAHDMEGDELKAKVGKWVESLPGRSLEIVEAEYWQTRRPVSSLRALCEAYMEKWTTRRIEAMFGIPRSSVAAELRKLSKLLPPDFRELV